MSKKQNKVVHINLMGGLLGLLFTHPQRALRQRIENENKDGWNCTYFIVHQDANLFSLILKLIVLIITIGLFTWGAGYMILFEKEIEGE
ncbi:MAG: hypothetical protein OXG08_04610 [Gammaproteobacteria bacterium]|nr:hypothetical protein [Gammaproteobacteria bacterium]